MRGSKASLGIEFGDELSLIGVDDNSPPLT